MEEFQNATDDYQINLFEETKAFKPAFVFGIIAGIIYILTPFLPLSTVCIGGQSVRKSLFSIFCEAIGQLFSSGEIKESELGYLVASLLFVFSMIFFVRFIILLKRVKAEMHLFSLRMSDFYFEFIDACCVVYLLVIILGSSSSFGNENILNAFSMINVTNLIYISVSFIGILFTFIANWSTSLTRVELGKALYLFLEMALLFLIFIVAIYNPIITVKINMGDSENIKLTNIYLFDDSSNFSFFDKNLYYNSDMVNDILAGLGSNVDYYFALSIMRYLIVLSPCIIFLIAMFMERSLRKLVAPSGKNVLLAFLSSGKYMRYSVFDRRYSNKFISYKDCYWYIGTGALLFFINYICSPFMSFIDMWDKAYPKYLFCNASSVFLIFVGIVLLVYKRLYNKKLKQIK